MQDDRKSSHLTPPPPQKRIKSVDLYRAQHGLSPENDLKDLQPLLDAARAYRGDRSRDRTRSKDHSRSRDSSSQDLNKAELRDSLLGQALEAGTTLSVASALTVQFSTYFLFRLYVFMFYEISNLEHENKYSKLFRFICLNIEKTSRFGIVTSPKYRRRFQQQRSFGSIRYWRFR